MKSAKEIFAKNLQRLLKEKEVEQSVLAKYIGVSDASVSYWLNGEKYPRIDKIQKIADFFEVPKSQLTEEYPSTFIEVQPFAKKVPIIGHIKDGNTFELEENKLGYKYELIDTLPSDDVFYLQVQNNSMEPTIPNQSYVLIKKQNKVERGDIVAVRIHKGSEVTLMRVRHQEKSVMFLAPDNPKFDAILINENNSDTEIIGKAIRYTVEL